MVKGLLLRQASESKDTQSSEESSIFRTLGGGPRSIKSVMPKIVSRSDKQTSVKRTITTRASEINIQTQSKKSAITKSRGKVLKQGYLGSALQTENITPKNSSKNQAIVKKSINIKNSDTAHDKNNSEQNLKNPTVIQNIKSKNQSNATISIKEANSYELVNNSNVESLNTQATAKNIKRTFEKKESTVNDLNKSDYEKTHSSQTSALTNEKKDLCHAKEPPVSGLILKLISDDSSDNLKYSCGERVFEVINVKGDGNCLFRALSVYLFNDERDHTDIRKEIVQYAFVNWTQLKETLDATCPEKMYKNKTMYKRVMGTDREFGSDFEISVFVKTYKVNVVQDDK